ncbi:hypothetical protein L2755_21605 [Shewanella abyssi]|uniref:hypothetical protein n=1 Tax=Shewanella abyssi TaxID=311789 RepID=UPI00200C0259|nr:hypothetical protein [Shewanella abyssi]MCL1052195.1 hypothetical protein [Shewanella abyssi]
MKLVLKKKALKILSADNKTLPELLTPNVGGGKPKESFVCHSCIAYHCDTGILTTNKAEF